MGDPFTGLLSNCPGGGTIKRFQIAESMGFKSDFRQWEDLLRIGD
jgi:hypothetical protein